MGKISVRGIIEYKGRYLLVRNNINDGFWCLPGGGVEPGEDILTTLDRELIKELGVKPVIGNLLYVHALKGPDGHDVPSFYFHVRNGEDYTHIDLDKTSHGKIEIAEFGFKNITETYVLPKFLQTELADIAAENFNGPARIRNTELNV